MSILLLQLVAIEAEAGDGLPHGPNFPASVWAMP